MNADQHPLRHEPELTIWTATEIHGSYDRGHTFAYRFTEAAARQAAEDKAREPICWGCDDDDDHTPGRYCIQTGMHLKAITVTH